MSAKAAFRQADIRRAERVAAESGRVLELDHRRGVIRLVPPVDAPPPEADPDDLDAELEAWAGGDR
jgi:hypothetical protein